MPQPVAWQSHTHHRRRGLVALLTLTLAIATYLTVGASAAFASCVNDGQSQWIGMLHDEQIAGAQAYIDRYKPYVCDESWAWSMVLNNAYPGHELAQVGWISGTAWGSTPYYFYEFGTSPTNLNQPVLLGAVPNPTQLVQDKFNVYERTPGYFTFNINGVSQDNVLLNWRPNEGQWMDETLSDSDQVAGDTNHHVKFGDVSHIITPGGAWFDDTPASNFQFDTTTNGRISPSTTTNTFSTWDWRYCGEAVRC